MRRKSEPRRHPDPATEQRLETIRVKQRRVTACADLAKSYQDEIGHLHGRSRHAQSSGQSQWLAMGHANTEQIKLLQEEIRKLGIEQDTIAEALVFAIGELSADDLAFL